MNIFQMALFNVIILLFPLLIYLFYSMYVENFNKEKNIIYLDFALLSSMYLIISYNTTLDSPDLIVLLNIPLMIAYLRNRKLAFVCLSLSNIVIYYMNDPFSLFPMIIQYLLLFLFYLYCSKDKKNDLFFMNGFIIIKSLFLYAFYFLYEGFNMKFLTTLILIVSIYAIISYLVTFIYLKSENIIKLHFSMKELEKETQYRTSLFKITHEIKNPVAVCKSYLDMFNFKNPDHERYIPILKEEMDKILVLLQDFSSMNKIKIEKEILDVNLLLEEIINQFSPVLRENNIEFHYEIIDDEIYIEGDYNRLNQVFINIIKNAVEAKDKSKMSLILVTELIQNNIQIVISDTGCGFDMDDFNKIREPFYTTKKNGTGLGVSLSEEIISAHKGKLQYVSAIGKGTTVTITLPIVPL